MKNIWGKFMLMPKTMSISRGLLTNSLSKRLMSSGSQTFKPLNTEELVKFKAKYYTPASAQELQPLKEARQLYAKMHIHNRDLLVTEGDIVKLPVNMKDVEVGSKLHFNEVSQLGSRDYTLNGERIDPSIFDIQGTVIEKSRVKREVSLHTRRRRRHVRSNVHHNCLTAIRITKVALK